ncbi:response regulator [Candidatus Woesearchaeota archaeon]|nr:response regulator [Candidatus Woesearchaeota archaeon]
MTKITKLSSKNKVIISKKDSKKDIKKNTSQKNIMIVDDEPDNVTTVKTILLKNGYKVLTAVNAEDCLNKIKAGDKPDLILMDIMMPGTPVREIIPKLPKSIKIAYLSVVRTSEAEKEDLLNVGNIVDFIQKPFDINELLKKVKKIVGS